MFRNLFLILTCSAAIYHLHINHRIAVKIIKLNADGEQINYQHFQKSDFDIEKATQANYSTPLQRLELWWPQLYIITPTYTRSTQRVDLVRISHSIGLSDVMVSWYLVEDATKVKDPTESGISSHLQRFKEQVESKFNKIRITILKENKIRTVGNDKNSTPIFSQIIKF